MKIRPVGAELSHADGQTDMTMVIGSLFLFLRGFESVLAVSLESDRICTW